jgi:hypothetical protein
MCGCLGLRTSVLPILRATVSDFGADLEVGRSVPSKLSTGREARLA